MSEYIDSDWNERRLQRRRQREKRLIAIYIGMFSAIVVLIVVAIIVGSGIFSSGEASAKPGNTEQINGTENADGTEELTETESESQEGETYVYLPQPEWEEMLLTPNKYSRPQTTLDTVNGVVIHYVGNTGSTAKQNRDYFEDLATTHTTSASSHFVVGLRGEIIQCIPLNEIAYASRHRNADTISIEVCHPTDEGWFNADTYQAVIELTAWLMVEYDLEIDDVIRHYDVTGKICPKYYVENEDAWVRFKADIQKYMDENSEIKTR